MDDESRDDRLGRLAVSGILMDLLDVPTLRACRIARELTREQRAEITRAAGLPIRDQAAESVAAILLTADR